MRTSKLFALSLMLLSNSVGYFHEADMHKVISKKAAKTRER